MEREYDPYEYSTLSAAWSAGQSRDTAKRMKRKTEIDPNATSTYFISVARSDRIGQSLVNKRTINGRDAQYGQPKERKLTNRKAERRRDGCIRKRSSAACKHEHDGSETKMTEEADRGEEIKETLCQPAKPKISAALPSTPGSVKLKMKKMTLVLVSTAYGVKIWMAEKKGQCREAKPSSPVPTADLDEDGPLQDSIPVAVIRPVYVLEDDKDQIESNLRMVDSRNGTRSSTRRSMREGKNCHYYYYCRDDGRNRESYSYSGNAPVESSLNERQVGHTRHIDCRVGDRRDKSACRTEGYEYDKAGVQQQDIDEDDLTLANSRKKPYPGRWVEEDMYGDDEHDGADCLTLASVTAQESNKSEEVYDDDEEEEEEDSDDSYAASSVVSHSDSDDATDTSSFQRYRAIQRYRTIWT